jgi:hypothetical protein
MPEIIIAIAGSRWIFEKLSRSSDISRLLKRMSTPSCVATTSEVET